MIRTVAVGFVLVLSCVALVVSVAVLVGGLKPASLRIGPETPMEATAAVKSSSSGSAAASAVESDFTANEALAESAPQQQVVAGWATKDALEGLLRQSDVIAKQNADLSTQVADGTNALAARVDGLTALVTAIAFAAIAAVLALASIALGVLWRSPATAVASVSTPAEA